MTTTKKRATARNTSADSAVKEAAKDTPSGALARALATVEGRTAQADIERARALGAYVAATGDSWRGACREAARLGFPALNATRLGRIAAIADVLPNISDALAVHIRVAVRASSGDYGDISAALESGETAILSGLIEQVANNVRHAAIVAAEEADEKDRAAEAERDRVQALDPVSRKVEKLAAGAAEIDAMAAEALEALREAAQVVRGALAHQDAAYAEAVRSVAASLIEALDARN